MHIVYFARWHEKSTVRAGAFVRAIEEHALRMQYRFHARLTRAFCDWINALLVDSKSGRSSSCEAGGGGGGFEFRFFPP